jgi:dolichol-phosphate mannosyltransferase
VIKNLSIICPTLNERDNVAVIYQHIDRIVTCEWELIFVDDNSSDGTRLEIEQLSRRDRRVRLINRVGRKGLASAASEGFLCAVYDHCVLIDADLQHDINNINVMAEEVAQSGNDLVISSRFKVNQTLGLSSARTRLSIVGNGMIDLILRRQLTDPLSGCFLIRRERYLALHPSLILSGFKILFDILSCPDGRQLTVSEIPIKFLNRHSGESKLRKTVMLEFMGTYVTRMVERVIPLSFIKFSMIGALGVLLHYLILSFFLKLSGFDFAVSQLVTSYLVMVSNFLLNNRYTFSANRLFGGQLVFGLMKFMFFCSFGALISLSFAFYLKDTGLSPVAAGVLGTVAGSLWNFVLNSLYTWRGHGK